VFYLSQAVRAGPGGVAGRGAGAQGEPEGVREAEVVPAAAAGVRRSRRVHVGAGSERKAHRGGGDAVARGVGGTAVVIASIHRKSAN